MCKLDRLQSRGIRGDRDEKGTDKRLTYRQFIQASYPSIKSSQPDLKFMIREAQGVNARAFVRFGESRSIHFILSRPWNLGCRSYTSS